MRCNLLQIQRGLHQSTMGFKVSPAAVMVSSSASARCISISLLTHTSHSNREFEIDPERKTAVITPFSLTGVWILNIQLVRISSIQHRSQPTGRQPVKAGSCGGQGRGEDLSLAWPGSIHSYGRIDVCLSYSRCHPLPGHDPGLHT